MSCLVSDVDTGLDSDLAFNPKIIGHPIQIFLVALLGWSRACNHFQGCFHHQDIPWRQTDQQCHPKSNAASRNHKFSSSTMEKERVLAQKGRCSLYLMSSPHLFSLSDLSGSLCLSPFSLSLLSFTSKRGWNYRLEQTALQLIHNE